MRITFTKRNVFFSAIAVILVAVLTVSYGVSKINAFTEATILTTAEILTPFAHTNTTIIAKNVKAAPFEQMTCNGSEITFVYSKNGRHKSVRQDQIINMVTEGFVFEREISACTDKNLARLENPFNTLETSEYDAEMTNHNLSLIMHHRSIDIALAARLLPVKVLFDGEWVEAQADEKAYAMFAKKRSIVLDERGYPDFLVGSTRDDNEYHDAPGSNLAAHVVSHHI